MASLRLTSTHSRPGVRRRSSTRSIRTLNSSPRATISAPPSRPRQQLAARPAEKLTKPVDKHAGEAVQVGRDEVAALEHLARRFDKPRLIRLPERSPAETGKNCKARDDENRRELPA